MLEHAHGEILWQVAFHRGERKHGILLLPSYFVTEQYRERCDQCVWAFLQRRFYNLFFDLRKIIQDIAMWNFKKISVAFHFSNTPLKNS